MQRGIATLAVLALAPGTGAAQAQQTGANDPSRGSPSGTVYELPLDAAREQAGPSPRDGGSPIRSENGFGSSSEVPGIDDGSRKSTPRSAGTPVDGSFAKPRGPAKDRAIAADLGDDEDDGTSMPLAVLLLAVTALVGAGIGAAAIRSDRKP